jgi:hypothetical protein
MNVSKLHEPEPKPAQNLNDDIGEAKLPQLTHAIDAVLPSKLIPKSIQTHY